MTDAPKQNEAKKLNLENFIVDDGRVYVMGDISGTMSKFLPMCVPPEVEKEVLRRYSEMPDGVKARKRKRAGYLQIGSGYVPFVLPG
jgi:hypothetical protein